MNTLLPAGLTGLTDLSLNEVTFEQKGKSFIQMADFITADDTFELELNGKTSTEGINEAKFGTGKARKIAYSLGLIPDSSDDVEGLDLLKAKVVASLPEGWEYSEIFKEEVIYLKLKTTKDGKRFTNHSNVKIDPKKVTSAPLSRGQTVVATVEPKAWYNLADKKAGISFNVINLEFEEITQPAKKLKSVEESAPSAKKIKSV